MNSLTEFDFPSLSNFAENKLIIWRDGKSEEIYTYNDVIRASKEIQSVLMALGVQDMSRMAIKFDHCPQILPVILSILNMKSCFCPLPTHIKEEQIFECLERLESNLLISGNLLNKQQNNVKLKSLLTVFSCEIYFYVYETKTHPKSYPFCYIVQTSGSTGLPKIIKVPHSCIMPNIKSLSLLFKVTSEDIIFVTAPPTFDPFVVDIFLALKNGAALLMVPKHIKLNSSRLVEVINPEHRKSRGATITQMTPSVLKVLCPEILEKIISNENSDLRILVLGGEPFPKIDELKSWQIWNTSKRKLRVYNIYGITEVSCWSTIHEITENTKEVVLGDPLDEDTFLEVRDSRDSVISEGTGELFIGSKKRKCLINDESLDILDSDEILYRATGDLVSINKDKQIFFKGRTNEIIKRFGHRVNLKMVEEVVEHLLKIPEVFCVFDETSHRLILFLNSNIENLKSIQRTLKDKLEGHEIPDEIIFVESFPLSGHGKVSKNKLLELYTSTKDESFESFDESKEGVDDIFRYWVIQILKFEDHLSAKRLKISFDNSFISLGGNSFQALNLITKLENLTKTSNPEILEMLLRTDCSLNEIFSKLKSVKLRSSSVAELNKDNNFDPPEKRSIDMKISWRYNMKKCIDANPTVFNLPDTDLVSVGSHSHLLVNLSIESGTVISSLELPDRIESQVAVTLKCCGIVGCYNGFLYKFDLRSGNVIWEFDSCGMIKCKPLILGECVIFGNYSENSNLFCLNENDGTCKWSIRFGHKVILSSPTRVDEKSFVVGTLDGMFGKIGLETGEIIWTSQLTSPIFSTSQKFSDDHILVAEVTGRIHCFNSSGTEDWQFNAKGMVFSSFEILKNEDGSNCIYFGCHDSNLYCLQVIDGKQFTLKWKTKLESQIYSTPKRIHFENKCWIVVCSTLGFVNILDAENGSHEAALKLNGEIFSSPAIYENKILVGCRDNNLYSIELSKV